MKRLYTADYASSQQARPNKPGKSVATYNYPDQNGKLLFQVVRSEPKRFWQRRPNGNGGWINEVKSLPELVPYRLPEVLKADKVCIAEGEKDCDRLAQLGIVSTCNPMGAGKWRAEYNRYFKGKQVFILPDNDPPGRDHAQNVARNLHGVAEIVKVLELLGLPEKGDVSDWLNAGGTREQLLSSVEAAPEFDSATSDPRRTPDRTGNKADPCGIAYQTGRGS